MAVRLLGTGPGGRPVVEVSGAQFGDQPVRLPEQLVTPAVDAKPDNRFFIAERTILLLRFDPMTRDSFKEVRLELAPHTAGGHATPTDAFALSAATSPTFASIATSGRAAAEAANANLADAIAKMVSGDGLSRFLDVTALSSSRRANSYRSADELDLTFSWNTMPIDSRLIRAILVLHFTGTVPATAFASGIRERAPNSATPSGYTIPATYRNLRFMGLADELDDDHAAGTDTLSIKCRDLTAILLDNKVSPTTMKEIKVGATILDAIKALLATLPSAQIIRGPFPRPANIALRKITNGAYVRTATSAKKRNKADGGGTAEQPVGGATRGASKEQGDSYWDAITDLCIAHGLVPMLELDKLVIQEPRTYFTGVPEVAGSPNTPSFPTPHRLSLGQKKGEPRVMVFGRNVESLKFKRKLTGVKAPHVRVVAFDPDQKDASKRLVQVDYPDASNKQATSVDPTGKNASAEYLVVPVYGITSKRILRRVARQTYENISHGEFGISFSTSDPASLGPRAPDGTILPGWDGNDDPDLLDLKAGDPVRILVAPTQRNLGAMYSLSELNQMLARVNGLAGVESAIKFLQDRGWELETATQLVKLLRSANPPDVFRVQGVSFAYNGESGDFTVDVDARDYARIRADQADPANTGDVPHKPRLTRLEHPAVGGSEEEAEVDDTLADAEDGGEGEGEEGDGEVG